MKHSAHISWIMLAFACTSALADDSILENFSCKGSIAKYPSVILKGELIEGDIPTILLGEECVIMGFNCPEKIQIEELASDTQAPKRLIVSNYHCKGWNWDASEEKYINADENGELKKSFTVTFRNGAWVRCKLKTDKNTE